MLNLRTSACLVFLLGLLVAACRNDVTNPSETPPPADNLWQPAEVPPFAAPVKKFLSGLGGRCFAHIGGEVARSLDSGKTWFAVTSSARFATVDIDKSGNLYGGENGAYSSTDNGSTWLSIGGDKGGVQGLAVIANQWLLTVSYSGASCYRSTNRGQSWQQLPGIPGYGEFLVYNEKRRSVYLRTFYHGANVNLWSSDNNGDSWTGLHNFSYTTNYPGFTMTVDSTGEVWTLDSDGTLFSGLGFERRSSIPGARVIVANDPDLLLVGGNGFQFSTDRGRTWTINSSGMTDTVVTAIGIRPGGMVLAGTNTGKIYRSTRPVAK